MWRGGDLEVKRLSKVPATLILELAKGQKDIAELRFKGDIARDMYKAGFR